MMRDVKSMLRDYFDVMDVPDDEDGLIRFVTEKFGEQRDYYTSLDARYDGHKYPDRALVQEAIHLMDDVLSQKKDNIALIERVLNKEDALFDNKEAMSNGIENFFKTQVTVFDQAVQFEKSLHDDLDCIAENEEAHKALNTIRLIIMVQTGSKFNYNRIRELNPLMDTVRTAHDKMLEEKRVEILETVRQCMEATHTAANGDSKVSHLIEKSDRYFSQCKEKIAELKSLALLDAFAYMNLIEHWGSGIPRIIDKVKAAGLQEPEFIGGEVDLRINIYRGQVDTNNAIINANDTKNGANGVKCGADDGTNGAEVPLNKEQTQIEKLLQIIEKNPSATQAYYAEKMGISKRTVGRYIN